MSAFATVRSLAAAAAGFAVAGAALLPSVSAVPTGQTNDAAAARLPEGMQFEEGLTLAQQQRIAEIVDSAPTMLAASTRGGGSCAAKTACYASTCWIPFVGLACLACDNIQCRRDVGDNPVETDVVHPYGMQFEAGLSTAQKQRIVEIVESAPTMLSAASTRGGGSCAAKTACYASTCWIPFVGLACLACDNVQCRRDAELPAPVLPLGMQFEKGLSTAQQQRLVEIVESAPVIFNAAATRGGGSCSAKTACYASTCWIPFLGVACLACDNIQC